MAFCQSSVALKPGRQEASDASAIHWNAYKYFLWYATRYQYSKLGSILINSVGNTANEYLNLKYLGYGIGL